MNPIQQIYTCLQNLGHMLFRSIQTKVALFLFSTNSWKDWLTVGLIQQLLVSTVKISLVGLKKIDIGKYKNKQACLTDFQIQFIAKIWHISLILVWKQYVNRYQGYTYRGKFHLIIFSQLSTHFLGLGLASFLNPHTPFCLDDGMPGIPHFTRHASFMVFLCQHWAKCLQMKFKVTLFLKY